MILFFKHFPRNYIAMAIWPFIFVKNESILKDNNVLNHERIHFRQQIELLWLPFFIWYFTEFLIRFIQHKDWDKAYYNISFEKEAYQHENNHNYIKRRPLWGFYKYL